MAECDIGWARITMQTLHQNQFIIKGPWAFINYKRQVLFWTENSDKEILSNLSDGYALIRVPKIATSSFKCFFVEIFIGLQLEQNTILCLLFGTYNFKNLHHHNPFFLLWKFEMFPKFFHRFIHDE